nr:MAG TPA: hypothetical protein [Caudoviricetes sp.]
MHCIISSVFITYYFYICLIKKQINFFWKKCRTAAESDCL